MTRWFRFYDDALNDPKIVLMPEALRWHWVAILCVASKNEGILPNVQDVAFGLRLSQKKAQSIIDDLLARGLLDRVDEMLTPHNWTGRQYQSDSSAERVKRHREKRVAAGLERQWTAPKQLRQQVYERDGFACVYCGSTEKLSLDHRTPEIRGGTHDPENLATACLSCNGAKRDMTEQEYRVRAVTVTPRETLLKRPQSTEQNTDKDAASKDAPHAQETSDEADLYRRGKLVLGQSSGGLIARLLKSKKGSVPLARAAIEQAATKQDAREYVGRIISGSAEARDDFRNPLAGIQ